MRVSDFPADLVDRIKADFGPTNSEEALSALLAMGQQCEELQSPRIMRCAIYVARGKISTLRDAITLAKTDWRDLIVWAEYDGKFDERLRDLSLPFDQIK